MKSPHIDDAGQDPGFLAAVDRLGRYLMDHPVWPASIVLLALIALPLAVWLDLRHLSNESLSRQAGDLNEMVSDIRGYYSSNVVGRVVENNGAAVATHNYRNTPGGIPIPATLSLELGQVIGQQGTNIGYRFVSDEPFKGRAPHELDGFELQALKQLRASRNPDDNVTVISGSLLNRQIKMAVPVMMGAACVACHNSHPETPRNDWEVGDIRGIQSITIDQPIAANLLSFRFLLMYFALAGATGLLFAALQWRQAVRFAGLNNQLETANSFLASVSVKISRYLSPQVYKSIFSGERDAVIATERKKLTIFFSDIESFTVATESLQPEELTQLLNEYFTEMAKIADQYGATVDKFIGDAILAFFGDPQTHGAKEDALNCVNMAIAMQRRLDALGREWHQRGIEKPLRTRMGINTGYCNVGNFGSNDRMDYTIIGAEANLAARLESIAEPGGIVMSFETFALVRDHVMAKPLDPITLKGISRQIVPYVLEGIHDEAAAGQVDIIDTSSDQMRLYLDPSAMDEAERLRAEKILVTALGALRRIEK